MAAVSATYRVVVRRDPEDARFWLADVDGLSGAHTSSRSIASLDRYVREVIVMAADLPDGAENTLDLDWRYETGTPDLDDDTERVRKLRQDLEVANRDLGKRTAALANELVRRSGLSVREAATLLGISPSRVDQMIRQDESIQDVA
jgi:DNA-directed RNA polymerase specialized sigma24 family protein